MITAERLQVLTSYNSGALAKTLATSGYAGMSFAGAKFLGITNGGQFCYRVEYYDEDGRGQTFGKVFLTYNPAEDRVIADIG
jgi:hypothetical protein